MLDEGWQRTDEGIITILDFAILDLTRDFVTTNQPDMKTAENISLYEQMAKDPSNYKWGIFYYNPIDPRVWLPKRVPWFGWTLNFANWKSYLLLIAIAAAVAALGLLIAL